ncbi:hypothetical protein GQ457_02G037790 [Hibiscus cannabinus]
MALLDKLPTKDGLVRMGIVVDVTCLNCGSMQDNRNHLFFYCNYSKMIWKSIMQLCALVRDPMCWENEVRWAFSCLKGKSLLLFLLRKVY